MPCEGGTPLSTPASISSQERNRADHGNKNKMLPRDIEALAHTCLNNVKNYRVRSLRLGGSQGDLHAVVSLLEDLQSIEQREREDFSARFSEAGDARRRGEPGLSVASLPGLPALQAPADSPKDIIFNAFIHDPPFRSLTPVHTDKLDKLVRSVALALRTASDPDVFLQGDEDDLLTFLVTHQQMPRLQQLLYQVLYCEQVTSLPRYDAFVRQVLDKIPDVATAGQFIRVLPRLTDDVWTYLREHSEQIEELFEILKVLIQTSEEGHKGLTMVFAIVEHASRDLQKRAIELISKQLYFICPGIIEERAVADFKTLW